MVPGGVAVRVVDRLEAVQVEEQHRQRAAVTTRGLDRAGESVAEQEPVRQAGERVVLRQVGHALRHRARRPDIVEDQHGTGHETGAVADRRSRVLDRRFVTVATDQQAVRTQADGRILQDRQRQGIRHRLAAFGIDDADHVLQGPPTGFCGGPARHALRHRVQIGDDSDEVGREHSIADRVERELCAPVLAQHRLAACSPVDHAGQRLRQRLGIEIIEQQVVLSSAPHRAPRNRLVAAPAHDEDWQSRLRAQQRVNGSATATIPQAQADHHGCDHLPPWIAQPFDDVLAATDALDHEALRTRAIECRLHRLGHVEVGEDQQLVTGHRLSAVNHAKPQAAPRPPTGLCATGHDSAERLQVQVGPVRQRTDHSAPRVMLRHAGICPTVRLNGDPACEPECRHRPPTCCWRPCRPGTDSTSSRAARTSNSSSPTCSTSRGSAFDTCSFRDRALSRCSRRSTAATTARDRPGRR